MCWFSPSQLRRVTQFTSQFPTAPWMTRSLTWCVGPRRIALCCRGSAKRGICWSRSSTGGWGDAAKADFEWQGEQNILHRTWDMNQLNTDAVQQCWEKLHHQGICILKKHSFRAELQQAAHFPHTGADTQNDYSNYLENLQWVYLPLYTAYLELYQGIGETMSSCNGGCSA